MTLDLDQRLADLRRAPRWPADERANILELVLAAEQTPHREDLRLIVSRPTQRRRRAVALAAAGLAAAACIAVPAVLPAGSPGAADQAAAAVQALHHLAHVATVTPVSPSDHLGPNQYVHLVDVQRQTALAGQPAVESRFEYWSRPDGLTWQRRHVRLGATPAHEEVWLLPPGDKDPDYPSPQYLRLLPTQPAALEAYLRAHTVGSTSSDERVFVAVGSIAGRGLATPKLRAAAIEVLSRLGHVRLGDYARDSRGTPVQEFEFVDTDRRAGEIQTLVFDTRTAQITEVRNYLHGKLHFRSTIPLFEVVDTVPADIRENAVAQK
jgi:hypothetical protein